MYLKSYKVLDASSYKLFSTLTSIPSLDANGTKDELFKKKAALLDEKSQNI